MTRGDWPDQIAAAYPERGPQSVGALVYVYGTSAATVLHADAEGAIVREHDDNGETWCEWLDLWPSPAQPLRFGITREPLTVGPEWSPWAVYGTRPDESGDPMWGHFPTWAEAISYATQTCREMRTVEELATPKESA